MSRPTAIRTSMRRQSRPQTKCTANFSTLFAEELAQPVSLTENGKRKKMPKRRALAKQVINKALIEGRQQDRQFFEPSNAPKDTVTMSRHRCSRTIVPQSG